jgi:hypothetical protein
MADKDTYSALELAQALGLKIDTVYRLLRQDKIAHIHLHSHTHHSARIPREEFFRLTRASGNGG